MQGVDDVATGVCRRSVDGPVRGHAVVQRAAAAAVQQCCVRAAVKQVGNDVLVQRLRGKHERRAALGVAAHDTHALGNRSRCM